MVDHSRETVSALSPADSRTYEANVAGPAALLVVKLHKIAERRDTPTRLVDKDAHDVHRLGHRPDGGRRAANALTL
ncbi:MAG TPA: hypothetical protein VK501_00790 [Baekduia sp.]|uniref:hypothetical protein n=1 Tax=Baekduia sp. TaxID=2600305 RepID=UPI002BD8A2D4|nr:hypothetical protein [Baekduia sp.]HMJ32423.1 hypothetical protein [Baekduia sp.]